MPLNLSLTFGFFEEFETDRDTSGVRELTVRRLRLSRDSGIRGKHFSLFRTRMPRGSAKSYRTLTEFQDYDASRYFSPKGELSVALAGDDAHSL